MKNATDADAAFDVRNALPRYDDATGPDGWLTIWGWERLAGDLDALAERHRAHGQVGQAQKAADRAADCRARRVRLIVTFLAA